MTLRPAWPIDQCGSFSAPRRGPAPYRARERPSPCLLRPKSPIVRSARIAYPPGRVAALRGRLRRRFATRLPAMNRRVAENAPDIHRIAADRPSAGALEIPVRSAPARGHRESPTRDSGPGIAPSARRARRARPNSWRPALVPPSMARPSMPARFRRRDDRCLSRTRRPDGDTPDRPSRVESITRDAVPGGWPLRRSQDSRRSPARWASHRSQRGRLHAESNCTIRSSSSSSAHAGGVILAPRK